MSDRIQKEIDICTADELSEFLQTNLGVELKGKETTQQLRAKLSQVGWGVKFITVPTLLAPAAKHDDSERQSINTRKGANGKTEVRIMIHSIDKPGGDRPVPVGVNGRMMLVPRGEPCWVPEEYVFVLKNAIEVVYPEYDANSDLLGGLKGAKNISAYPFSYA